MLSVGELGALLTLDDSKFQKGMDDADKKSSKLGETASKAGMMAAAGMVTAGAAAGAFGYKAVMSASSLNESMSKTDNVFKGSARTIHEWSAGAAKDFGQSQVQAEQAAGTFGNLFVQLGIGADKAAGMSMEMTELASDFASFHDADISEVIGAQTAAFRGEYDALQRFVPTINGATVEQEALRQTGKKTTAELTAQEKALAVQTLMMKGAGDATGDFDRTNDSLANRMRIAQAATEDFSSRIGSKLLPMVLGAWDAFDRISPVIGKVFTGALEDAKKAVGPLVDTVQGFFANGGEYDLPGLIKAGKGYEDMSRFEAVVATAGGTLGPIFGTLKQTAGEFFDSLQEWIGRNEGRINEWRDTLAGIFSTVVEIVGLAFEAMRVAFDVVTGVILNIWNRFGSHLIEHLATAFDSILQVLTGVLDIIKGIFNVFIGVFTGDWSRAWEGVKQIFGGVWNALVGVVELAINAISTVIGAGTAIISAAWGYVWRGIQGVFAAVWDGITAYVRLQINTVVDIVKGLGGAISGAASGAFDGLKSAFRSAINWIIERWNGLSFGIPETKGPNGITLLPGVKLDTPNLPLLAKGGVIAGAGLAVVGDNGPELIDFNAGASVTPLPPGGSGGTSVTIDRIEINGVRDADDVLSVLPDLERALLAGLGRTG